MKKDARASDLVQPGHIFPLQAHDGGVLMRAGHTEAGCDLAAMAGLAPAAVICEIMNDDGTMARLPDLVAFAEHARPEDRHHRQPDRAPQPQRIADRARRHAQDAHAAGRVRLHRLHRQDRRPAPGADARPLDRERRGAGAGARAAFGARPARRRALRSLLAAAAGAGRAAEERARRGGAAQLRRGRRDLAAADAGAQPGRPPRRRSRSTCAPTASARRSCATSASRR